MKGGGRESGERDVGGDGEMPNKVMMTFSCGRGCARRGKSRPCASYGSEPNWGCLSSELEPSSQQGFNRLVFKN